MEAVRLSDVWFYYQGQAVLHEVNLSVEEGEFLGLIGPNGAGKTTLLKLILGLAKPAQGRVEVWGKDPSHLGRQRHLIGYISQRSLVDWQFPASVFDVVMMGRYGRIGLFTLPAQGDREAVLKNLERVGMAELARRQIGELSGGQQQRVFIARALAAEPRLLLLDEPLISLDARGQDEFYKLLASLHCELGLTIMLVSHEISMVSTYVEKIACLNQTLYAHAAPSEVLNTATLERVYGCEVELLAHGRIPHRVIREHE